MVWAEYSTSVFTLGKSSRDSGHDDFGALGRG